MPSARPTSSSCRDDKRYNKSKFSREIYNFLDLQLTNYAQLTAEGLFNSGVAYLVREEGEALGCEIVVGELREQNA